MGLTAVLYRLTDDELEHLRANPDVIPTHLRHVEESDQVDIDKAWHGIHFLLTGSAEEAALPLGFILDENTLIEGLYLGEGFVRGFDSTQVLAISAELTKLGSAELSERFDAKQMASEGVYPAIWDDGPDALQYLILHHAALAAFLKEAAARDNAILLVVS